MKIQMLSKQQYSILCKIKSITNLENILTKNVGTSIKGNIDRNTELRVFSYSEEVRVPIPNFRVDLCILSLVSFLLMFRLQKNDS